MHALIITALFSILTVLIGHLINNYLVNRRNRKDRLKEIYAAVFSKVLSKMIFYIKIRFSVSSYDRGFKADVEFKFLKDVYTTAKSNAHYLGTESLDDLYNISLQEITNEPQIHPDYFYIKLINSLLDELILLNKKNKVLSNYLLIQVLQTSILCKLYLLLQHELLYENIFNLLTKVYTHMSFEGEQKMFNRQHNKLKRHIMFPINSSNIRRKRKDVISVLNEYKEKDDEIKRFILKLETLID